MGADLLCNIQGSWNKSVRAWMCPNPCWWHLRCRGWLHGGTSPSGKRRGLSSAGDWEQKEPHWGATKRYQPCLYFQPFFGKKDS